eukprot:9427295-Alexandrium_andersonii.AAC.2
MHRLCLGCMGCSGVLRGVTWCPGVRKGYLSTCNDSMHEVGNFRGVLRGHWVLWAVTEVVVRGCSGGF